MKRNRSVEDNKASEKKRKEDNYKYNAKEFRKNIYYSLKEKKSLKH